MFYYLILKACSACYSVFYFKKEKMWVTQTGEQGIDWPQVLLSLPLPLCSLGIRDALILTVSAISAMDGKVMSLPWDPGKERVPPDRLRRQELGARSRPSFSSPLPARLLLPASKTWKYWSLADFFFSDPTARICPPPTSHPPIPHFSLWRGFLSDPGLPPTGGPPCFHLSCPPHPPHPHSFPFLLCWQGKPSGCKALRAQPPCLPPPSPSAASRPPGCPGNIVSPEQGFDLLPTTCNALLCPLTEVITAHTPETWGHLSRLSG